MWCVCVCRERKKEKERANKRERDIFQLLYFTSFMAHSPKVTVAMGGPGLNQEPGIRSFIWASHIGLRGTKWGPKTQGHKNWVFSGHWQGAGPELKQPILEPMPHNDSNVSGSG